MASEAWGRWGPEDEHGALNLIGSEQTLAALTAVSQGRVISLAQPLGKATPVAPPRHPIGHFMDRDGGDYAAGARRTGGFQFADDTLLIPAHSGTHLDALAHVWYDDRLYNGFPGETVRSTTGAQRCGADKLLPIIGRGVLVDLATSAGRPLEMGETVSRKSLEDAVARTRTGLRQGDVVLIRTGWNESTLDGRERYFAGEPGIGVEAAEWLAESGVAVVGADNYAIEPLPSPDGEIFPVHQRLIRDYGIPLLEGLILGPLAATGASTFLFIACPLPLVGATASPLAPVAVL